MNKTFFLKLCAVTGLVVLGGCSVYQPPQPQSSGSNAPQNTQPSIMVPTQSLPSATETQVDATPTEIQTDASFDLSEANKVLPEDIFEEVSFYGGGGGVHCSDENRPAISFEPLDGELMTLSTMIVCGWQQDESLTGIIEYPNGRSVTKPVPIMGGDVVDVPFYGMLGFKPTLEDPPGLYKFKMVGRSGVVEGSAYFSAPDGPRLFIVNDTTLLLYKFKPNESARLFYFRGPKFDSWQKYKVGPDGNLFIKISMDLHYALTSIVALGKQSGEARLLQVDPWGRSVDWIAQKSIVKIFCGVVQSHIALGMTARVAFTDGVDMRVRAKAGLQEKVLFRVPEGTYFFIVNGPKCVDGIPWWKVRIDDKTEGWMAEYDKGAYLIERMMP